MLENVNVPEGGTEAILRRQIAAPRDDAVLIDENDGRDCTDVVASRNFPADVDGRSNPRGMFAYIAADGRPRFMAKLENNEAMSSEFIRQFRDYRCTVPAC